MYPLRHSTKANSSSCRMKALTLLPSQMLNQSGYHQVETRDQAPSSAVLIEALGFRQHGL